MGLRCAWGTRDNEEGVTPDLLSGLWVSTSQTPKCTSPKPPDPTGPSMLMSPKGDKPPFPSWCPYRLCLLAQAQTNRSNPKIQLPSPSQNHTATGISAVGVKIV